MCIVYSEWIVFANRIGENPKASATSGRWLSVLQLFQDLSQRDLKATVPWTWRFQRCPDWIKYESDIGIKDEFKI